MARPIGAFYLTAAVALSPAARSVAMALEPGKKAPSFALVNEAGEKVRLADFKGRRVVLFFFPKAGTSG